MLLPRRSYGVKKIDYRIITHYHGDHVGGFGGLLARMPVGTIIDHGENREVVGTQIAAGAVVGGVGFDRVTPADEAGTTAPGGALAANPAPKKTTASTYADYVKLIGDHPHIVAKPGYTLTVDGMNIRVVAADAKVIEKPSPGAGEANPSCADMPIMESNNGEENAPGQLLLLSRMAG